MIRRVRNKRLNESSLSEITYSPDDSKALHRLCNSILKLRQDCYNTRNEKILENIFHIVDSLESISTSSDMYKKGKISVSFFEKTYKFNCDKIKERCNKTIDVINEDLDVPFKEETIGEPDDYDESVNRRCVFRRMK